MIKKSLIYTITIFLFMGNIFSTLYACSGLTLKAKNNSAVFARTLEWGHFNTNPKLNVYPRNYQFNSLTPTGLNGKKYKAKYGFVSIEGSAPGTSELISADSINEKGLSAHTFFFPGFAKYQTYDSKNNKNTISELNVTDYIASQFATLDEVKAGIKKINVAGVKAEFAEGQIAPFHWIVSDKAGNSIVIEYVDGKLNIYDNPLGIITNAPDFRWQMINLKNYINISAKGVPSKTFNGLDGTKVTSTPTGVGSEMLGLPGDFTPVSRFIRLAFWTQTARPTETSDETIYEAFRILDNFNVPATDFNKPTKDGFISRSSTIYTVAFDKNKGIMYYHTQNNRRVRAFKYSDINFDTLNKVLKRPLDLNYKQDIEYIKLNK